MKEIVVQQADQNLSRDDRYFNRSEYFYQRYTKIFMGSYGSRYSADHEIQQYLENANVESHEIWQCKGLIEAVQIDGNLS